MPALPARWLGLAGAGRLPREWLTPAADDDADILRPDGNVRIRGGLEQQYGTTVVLRVPVAKFREAFDAILKVGDVVSNSLAAAQAYEALVGRRTPRVSLSRAVHGSVQ